MNESRPALAALWMVGAIVAFTTMAVAGRELATEHDTFEIMLFRSLIGIVIVTAIATATGRLREIPTRRLSTHFWRNVFHFTGQNLWFYAVALIPLAELFALEFTSPLWVMGLAALFLGERLTWTKGFAGSVAITGVLMVARPDFTSLDPGHITAAASAIAFAATAIVTKRLTHTESITCILFWLTVLQAGMGILAAGYDGAIKLPETASLPWVLVIALCGLLAHFCVTTALRLAPASVVMPLDFARLPAAALVGAMLYGEALGLVTAAGAGLILLANWINIRGEIRDSRRVQS